MASWLELLPRGLLATRPARRLLDTHFRSRARRRVAELDHLRVQACQRRVLLGLVHAARGTRFGREHDFRRIRTPEDFRRLVPLRTVGQMWKDYWQPTLADPAAATWPEPVSCAGMRGAEANGVPSGLPVTPAFRDCRQAALASALALVGLLRPRAQLLRGDVVYLGGEACGQPAVEMSCEASAEDVPPWLRPCLLLPTPADASLAQLAEQACSRPVRALAGPADSLGTLLAQALQRSGRSCAGELWPRLAAVLLARGTAADSRAGVTAAVGAMAVPPLVLEVWPGLDLPFAIEDPRHGCLRLLVDHGVYYEFVPLDQLGRPEPCRLGAAEVETGVSYAIALTSPAGLWACLTGHAVRFEQREPLLLRPVEADSLPRQLARVAAPVTRLAHPFPPQPPHPRSGGRPAILPGRPGRTLLSARADRG